MPSYSSDSLALATAHDNLDAVLSRRKAEGELGVPNFIASLDHLPLESRHKMGTLIRRSFVKRYYLKTFMNKFREIESSKAFVKRTTLGFIEFFKS